LLGLAEFRNRRCIPVSVAMYMAGTDEAMVVAVLSGSSPKTAWSTGDTWKAFDPLNNHIIAAL
jgi:hypothetical protein